MFQRRDALKSGRRSTDYIQVSRSAAPEVATTRTMARILATLYAFGGVAGLAILTGLEPGPRRWVLIGMCGTSLVAAAAVARWGRRWPRSVFHLAVGAATVLISTAVLIAPDPVSSFAAATVIAFVVLDAHFFFPRGGPSPAGARRRHRHHRAC